MFLKRRSAIAGAVLIFAGAAAGLAGADVRGWLSWRGPEGTGVSQEKGLPDTWTLGGPNQLWEIPIAGGGTPIVANGRVFALGYEGTGPDLQEVLFCADAETGKKLWEARFNDFLSDITYDRYAIGSPAVDGETGNVYALTSAGLFSCFTPDGKMLWQHNMMEGMGRLTFTNGRTGSPLIEDDLVIVRGITSNWGGEGAAQDRMYAYDKKSGKLVWSASPGAPPKDNSFALPAVTWLNGKRVLVTGSGDGSIVCVNARTGETLWRYPVSAGGLNASATIHKGKVITIHSDENLNSSTVGGMTALKIDAPATPVEGGPPALPKSAEVWTNELGTVSSSPVLVGDTLYQVNKTGALFAVDANTGKVQWEKKLGPDQLHASPLYADGKLYVPIQNGSFYILRPTANGAEELAHVKLPGRCIGAPSAWNGKVYVFSTEKLFCFGKKGNNPGLPPAPVKAARPAPGKTVALQVLPAEVMLRPGEKASFTVRGIDANGFPTENFDASKAKWEKYVPPTARVRSEIDATLTANGEIVAAPNSKQSAGAFRATIGELQGIGRGRVVQSLPYKEDFEGYTPTEAAADLPDQKFAYPPLPWIGARFKFDIREVDGNKVLAKTLDNIFFQRAVVFLGHPEEKNYTFQADVMTDGSRRTMSSVGVINQHYMITLQGNSQELVVSSNDERIKTAAKFTWSPKTWYTIKSRVDVASDGSGVVRAKAWKKGDPEPAAWTLEVPHRKAHRNGAPGLFGFAPQSLFKCYVDNIVVTPNG
jgi:outer membrane protein assembly factor BamB